MAEDFRAKVTAELDTAEAESKGVKFYPLENRRKNIALPVMPIAQQ